MYYTSPHATYKMGKEAFMEEQRRWNSLTTEQRNQESAAIMEEWKRKQAEDLAKKKKEREQRNLAAAKHTYIYTDTTNTMENSEATIIWIVVMLVGSIFKGNWMIWIIATLIWWRFINRYKIREAKWDNGGKEEYFQKIEDACKGDKK